MEIGRMIKFKDLDSTSTKREIILEGNFINGIRNG